MNMQYHKTIADLQKRGIAKQYISGWAGSFLGNPKVEQQRITAAYEAGYSDGKNRNTNHAENWKT